ncbi:MAG TPA: serine hydrolase [Saprospiraceae bacterium]|nr:serine hydrolase [Saprospiraceae bacterium]HNT20328.1 serine hydrolase [Saprospiraceae bacterium]
MHYTVKSFLFILFSSVLVSLLESSCKNVEPKTELTLDSARVALQHLLARADSLELDTPYEKVPGDALSHQAAGFAKIMCSAVFISKLDPEFAAANLGGFVCSFEERKNFDIPRVDYQKKSVSVFLPDRSVRTAVYLGDQSQGCICLPQGEDKLHFNPTKVVPNLPEASKTPWPMGDLVAEEPWPAEVDKSKIDQAVQAAFEGDGMTAAFVVTYKGMIIAEKYGEHITRTTPLESWSMGKSLTATLMGILIQAGDYALDQAAPIPEWQKQGDERSKIKIQDILHMSSGLRFRAPQDPDYEASLGYPDHLYVYTGGINSFTWAATRPQQWPPNSVGRYRNSDPLLINYLIRLGVEKKGIDYHRFPQGALFDKIGIRTMVMETDPYGNFLTQGYELASARDWIRLGNLYLQDGVWNDERILPEGFVKFVSTLAEPWVKDGRPIYGGFFWINGDGKRPIPKEAYMMLGAGGQSTTIIPSHGLVIVRMGHYRGASAGQVSLDNAYKLILEAVPAL